jgi:hypothetical protein
LKLVPLIEARGPGEKVALEELEECNEAARTFGTVSAAENGG